MCIGPHVILLEQLLLYPHKNDVVGEIEENS